MNKPQGTPREHRSAGLQLFRRALILMAFLVLLLVLLLLRPLGHVLKTMFQDQDQRSRLVAGTIDDASRLNLSDVSGVRLVESDLSEEQLALMLAEARDSGFRVSIAGARHSMGGHTIYPGGISIDMSGWNRMEMSPGGDVLTVQSGARWHDVIAFLDANQRSVAIMQSNDSFSVGGSLSVNCHGWQYGKPPIASTVLSMRVMLADGSVVRCSRDENAELFSLVLGGYGLFGIILDADLSTVPNEIYQLEQHVVSTGEAFGTLDDELLVNPEIEMVYARMNVSKDDFLGKLIINGFIRRPGDPERLDSISHDGRLEHVLLGTKRVVFRGSEGSEYGKWLRWNAETRVAPALRGTTFTRNQLLDEGVETLENRSAETTDILHEYFVPRERAGGFLDSVRRIVRDHEADLLNVTIRQVDVDMDTMLRYADGPMIAFVMLFLQDRNAEGEAGMEAMTRELIEASLENEGRYYLPYRLHATRQQFNRAYPARKEFLELKRSYDPDELFQNEFYLKYGRDDSPIDSNGK